MRTDEEAVQPNPADDVQNERFAEVITSVRQHYGGRTTDGRQRGDGRNIYGIQPMTFVFFRLLCYNDASNIFRKEWDI